MMKHSQYHMNRPENGHLTPAPFFDLMPDRWCRWAKLRPRGKAPLSTTGIVTGYKEAGVQTLDEALASTAGDGVGWCLNEWDGLVVVDLDDGESLPEGLPGTYCERSPSGAGLHYWYRTKPGWRVNEHPGSLGIFSTGRFVATTFDEVGGPVMAPKYVEPDVFERILEERRPVPKVIDDDGLLEWEDLDGEEVDPDVLRANDDAQGNADKIFTLRDGIGPKPRGGKYGYNSECAAAGMAHHAVWKHLGERSDMACFTYVRKWAAVASLDDDQLKALVRKTAPLTSFYERLKPGWNRRSESGAVWQLAESIDASFLRLESWRRSDLEEKLGLSKSATIALLNQLRDVGVVERIGAGRSSLWRPTQEGRSRLLGAIGKLALQRAPAASETLVKLEGNKLEGNKLEGNKLEGNTQKSTRRSITVLPPEPRLVGRCRLVEFGGRSTRALAVYDQMSPCRVSWAPGTRLYDLEEAVSLGLTPKKRRKPLPTKRTHRPDKRKADVEWFESLQSLNAEELAEIGPPS